MKQFELSFVIILLILALGTLAAFISVHTYTDLDEEFNKEELIPMEHIVEEVAEDLIIDTIETAL